VGGPYVSVGRGMIGNSVVGGIEKQEGVGKEGERVVFMYESESDRRADGSASSSARGGRGSGL
jgi:hypothetical protein